VASFTKFNQFSTDLSTGKHNFGSHALYCGLTNTAPNTSTNQVWADITEISAGNGYTAGGSDSAASGAGSAGTYTVTGTNITWTASGGAIAAFRYVVLYNHTQTSPVKPLLGYWDYGSALTLNTGDSLTVKFNNGVSGGTILTIA